MSVPGVGDVAPAFDLPGTGDKHYRLEDYRGDPVVLVFYPADNSPVCTLQLRSYSERFEGFGDVGALVLALSPQAVGAHEAFALAQNLRMPLLSDIDKKVGRDYNIVGPLGFYRRSVFVVDSEGLIKYAHRSLTSLNYVSFDKLIAAVRSERV